MAKDSIHTAVKNALEKDGWLITNDPFYIESGGIEIEIDLAAEKFIVAEKGLSKILVEIKSLKRRSLLYDFHAAIGQYIDYRGVLSDEQIERQIFLAIPDNVYRLMMLKPFYQKRLKENQVNLIIIDTLIETVVQWIK